MIASMKMVDTQNMIVRTDNKVVNPDLDAAI